MLVGAVVRWADVVRDSGRRDARATRERCGMVIDRAAATGLSRCDERVRAAAAAAGEQPGQRCGDPRDAPLALGRAAAARSWQGAVHPGDRALLAAAAPAPEGRSQENCTWLCARIPCSADTAIWPRAGAPGGPGPGARGGPCTVRSVRVLALRLVRENPGYVDPGIMWSLAAD
jgi:hypothetical protein